MDLKINGVSLNVLDLLMGLTSLSLLRSSAIPIIIIERLGTQ